MTTFSTQSALNGDAFDLDLGFRIDHRFYTPSQVQPIALFEDEYVLSREGMTHKEEIAHYYITLLSHLSINPTFYVYESYFTIDICIYHNWEVVELFTFISQQERNRFLTYSITPEPHTEHWFSIDPNTHLAMLATDAHLFFQQQNTAVTVQEAVYQFTKVPFQQKMHAAIQRTIELINGINEHLQQDYFNFRPSENVND